MGTTSLSLAPWILFPIGNGGQEKPFKPLNHAM
jgi:hypothetical protein